MAESDPFNQPLRLNHGFKCDKLVLLVKLDAEAPVHSVFQDKLLERVRWKLNHLPVCGARADTSYLAAVIAHHLRGTETKIDDKRRHEQQRADSLVG
jgi:hypothetical protein